VATINQLIERTEQRLFLAAGLDVQIHAENQLIEMIRGVYTTLFEDFWYPEFTYYRVETLDNTTGVITGDISTYVLRYKDINSVYWDQEAVPLPQVAVGSPMVNLRRKSIGPSSDRTKVFQVFPADTTGPVGIWYRTRINDAIWEAQDFDNEFPFDDEVVMYGVVYEFLAMDDSNQTATAMYEKKFQGRQSQLRSAQWNIPIAKQSLTRDGPATRWS